MRAYLANTWIRIGLALVVLGWGPLITIGVLAEIGLWPDPNPNPIGPGLLFLFTSWPAIICLAVGVAQIRRRQPGGGNRVSSGTGPVTRPASRTARPAASVARPEWSAWARQPLVRGAAGIGGILLAVHGAAGLRAGEGRGAAAAIVGGAALLTVALTGRIPAWFRR